jgi:hypothetical protein
MNKFNTEQTEQALNKVSRGMNVQQFSLTSVDWKADIKRIGTFLNYATRGLMTDGKPPRPGS